MIKTRLQIYDLHHPIQSDSQPLLSQSQQPTRPSTLSIACSAYQNEGAAVFFRGIGICSARAFVVNAVQWAVRILFPIFVSNVLVANVRIPVGLRVDDEGIESRRRLSHVKTGCASYARQFHLNDWTAGLMTSILYRSTTDKLIEYYIIVHSRC